MVLHQIKWHFSVSKMATVETLLELVTLVADVLKRERLRADKLEEELEVLCGRETKDAGPKTKAERKPKKPAGRKAKDPDAPKRPKNAYFIFQESIRAEVSAEVKADPTCAGMKHPQRLGEIARRVKMRWDALSLDERDRFHAAQFEERMRYQTELAAYHLPK